MNGKRSTRREFLAATCAGVGLLHAQAGLGDDASSVADARRREIGRLQTVRFQSPDGRRSQRYVEVSTRGGVTGRSGPLLDKQAAQIDEHADRLGALLAGRDPVAERSLDGETLWEALYPGRFKAYLDGRDPLTGESIWGTRRSERHTPTGYVILALSAVDNALWDLRGRILDKPAFRLLGGRRERLPVYVSSFAEKPADAMTRARQLFDQGFVRQKWFFPHGPSDGAAGLHDNIELVRVLREDLGAKATLMFDGFRKAKKEGDVDYAVRLARAMLPYKPFWLEEPLGPEDLEGYTRIKGETGILLATGEHTYTRWNIRPFLDRKILSFVQSDPEWCGGISELGRICSLVEQYENVRVVPHGHHVLAASHVVASRPEQLCPLMEYGPGWAIGHQAAQQTILEPKAGYFDVPNGPGLGPEIAPGWSKAL
ncbi:MAG: enolase C-terminal domain-like protein [Planctomycetota bacterium]